MIIDILHKCFMLSVVMGQRIDHQLAASPACLEQTVIECFPPMAVVDGLQQNLSIFDPVSPPAESIRTLSLLIFAITGFIFIVVELILFYAIFRFWRRGTQETSEPPQVYGSQPIEIAWTAAPALIVFVIMLVVIRTEWELHASPAQPPSDSIPLHVTVIGRQWWWEYQYERYQDQPLGFITANELHIPASTAATSTTKAIPRPVFLTLQSADVCHSYWVPRLAGKTDLIPGRTNHLWFQTAEIGTFVGQCAEYCGTQHANMLLRVTVDTPEDFERWLENQKKPAVEAQAAQGKAAFLAQSCINCHRVRGTPAAGTFAPDLTHLMSRETLAAGVFNNTPDNLRKWIDNPQAIKPGCLMPAFGLSEQDRQSITAYLLTLQ